MALIFPVYQRVRNVTLSYSFSASANPTSITSTSNPVAGLDLGHADNPLTSGLLCGVSVTLQANASSVASDYAIEIFSENSATLTSGTSSELYSATFSFAAPGATISDMLSQPIPILAQPFVRVEQTTTALATNVLLIKFYVQSIAGN